MSRHATFQVELVDGVICITDLDDGKSVTNDAEWVIEQVGQNYDLSKHRVVYRDTEGQWDGLAVKDGRFAGFVYLTWFNRDDAVEDARSSDGLTWSDAGNPYTVTPASA